MSYKPTTPCALYHTTLTTFFMTILAALAAADPMVFCQLPCAGRNPGGLKLSPLQARPLVTHPVPVEVHATRAQKNVHGVPKLRRPPRSCAPGASGPKTRFFGCFAAKMRMPNRKTLHHPKGFYFCDSAGAFILVIPVIRVQNGFFEGFFAASMTMP